MHAYQGMYLIRKCSARAQSIMCMHVRIQSHTHMYALKRHVPNQSCIHATHMYTRAQSEATRAQSIMHTRHVHVQTCPICSIIASIARCFSPLHAPLRYAGKQSTSCTCTSIASMSSPSTAPHFVAVFATFRVCVQAGSCGCECMYVCMHVCMYDVCVYVCMSFECACLRAPAVANVCMYACMYV